MKHSILHISDLHGVLKPLWKVIRSGKSFDFIILTGDIAPTHVKYMTPRGDGFRIIDTVAEAKHQTEWATNALKPLLDQIPHKHLIAVNGNHDFLDFAPVFPEATTLFKGAKTVVIDGIKFGIATGIEPLRGEWHEEVPEYDFNERLLTLDPDIQILITHAPPNQVLDLAYGGDRIGYNCLYKHIFGLSLGNVPPTFTHLTKHLFGHAHESAGFKEIDMENGRVILFSNAACGANVVEL
jgi:Icc-related predicted phosphoesterase